MTNKDEKLREIRQILAAGLANDCTIGFIADQILEALERSPVAPLETNPFEINLGIDAPKRTMMGVPKSQWRPISEAPKEFGKELIIFDGQQIAIGKWYDYEALHELGAPGWLPLKNPTHWQPLPQPPTKDK